MSPFTCSNPKRRTRCSRWGFLNAIFEEKEYGDARVLEKLAREMIAKDPALKTEFDAKLASDKAFAENPEARLEFFYQRSPWYAQQNVGVTCARRSPMRCARATAETRSSS